MCVQLRAYVCMCVLGFTFHAETEARLQAIFLLLKLNIIGLYRLFPFFQSIPECQLPVFT